MHSVVYGGGSLSYYVGGIQDEERKKEHNKDFLKGIEYASIKFKF